MYKEKNKYANCRNYINDITLKQLKHAPIKESSDISTIRETMV